MTSRKSKSKKDLQKQLVNLKDQLKRALADYDNLEKRVVSRRQELVELARVEILDKLLSVLDDLERAETHLKDRGLTMTVDQFRGVLKSEGVEEIEAEGRNFDPEKMDCVSLVSGKKNRVVKVTQKGYILKKRVIRPAKVEVGRGKK
jgi:molecular chaperone GrpE